VPAPHLRPPCSVGGRRHRRVRHVVAGCEQRASCSIPSHFEVECFILIGARALIQMAYAVAAALPSSTTPSWAALTAGTHAVRGRMGMREHGDTGG